MKFKTKFESFVRLSKSTGVHAEYSAVIAGSKHKAQIRVDKLPEDKGFVAAFDVLDADGKTKLVTLTDPTRLTKPTEALAVKAARIALKEWYAKNAPPKPNPLAEAVNKAAAAADRDTAKPKKLLTKREKKAAEKLAFRSTTREQASAKAKAERAKAKAKASPRTKPAPASKPKE